MFKLWSWSFFFIMCKILSKFEKFKKILDNVFGLADNDVWTWCQNLSQLWQEYMWLAVNVLPNNPKISDLTKKDVFWLNLFQINWKVWWKCRGVNVVSVWVPWTRWFRRCVVKQELLAIQGTTFFGVNNLESIWAMKLIFFLKMEKILCTF